MIQVLGRESLRSEASEKTASEWWSSNIGIPGYYTLVSPLFFQVSLILCRFLEML